MSRRSLKSPRHLAGRGFMLLAVIAAIVVHGGLAKQESEVEEEQASPTGVAMAATLLGTISFLMCMYYFTNYDDPDVKRKSWEIISSTISIFCSVLMFQSLNDIVEAYFIDYYDLGPFGTFLTDMTHMLVWFSVLQLSLAWFSGAITIDYDAIKDDEAELAEEIERRELSMKCWAVLLAHLTGFASINAWGSLQQLPLFAQNPIFAMVAVIVAFVGQFGLQQFTSMIRDKVAMGDDADKDPFEKMWDEETEEAETDVMSLTISFMFVNAWRFAIIECMPTNEGKEREPACSNGDLYNHSIWQMIALWGSAFVCNAINFGMNYGSPELVIARHLPVKPKVAERIYSDIMCSISMASSWCTFYGIQMVLAGVYSSSFQGEDELMSVILALVCSLGAFGMLIPLDWLADQDWTDEKCDEGIRAAIDAFALLVGFAWEQCFDNSVDALASSTSHPHWSKFLLSVFCAGLLVPAWKWYMLPFILRKGWRFGYVGVPADLERIAAVFLEEESAQEKEEQEEAERLGKEQKRRMSKTAETINKISSQAGSKPGYVPPIMQASDVMSGHGHHTVSDEVAVLKAALAKAEKERDTAQAMLSCQMETMMENMKKLNLTVTRIP